AEDREDDEAAAPAKREPKRIAQPGHELGVRSVILRGEPLRQHARPLLALAPDAAERVRRDQEDERGDDPGLAPATADVAHEPEPERQGDGHADRDRDDG